MPFDIPEESIFVLIFLLISFLNWIGEKVKKAKQASAQRRPQVRGYEEEPPAFPTAPAPQAPSRPQPSRQEDPMRQILESLGIPTETPPPIPEPSPPIAAPRQESSVTEIKDKAPWGSKGLSDKERAAMENLAAGRVEATRHRDRGSINKEVRKLLTADNTKTAFVLKEILDQPKCFDS
ncbi:MAG: hypothetical protein GWQ05_09440 [Verrucomicrobiaceae bacterium]|nr:hypothetical protein [Verrucomicrobiaceae bacterium]